MTTNKCKQTKLAITLAALMAPGLAPGLALAANQQARQQQPTGAMKEQTRDLSAEARDAFREGSIWATFAFNPALDAYRLKVDVQGDRAVLKGQVDSAVEKDLAERIAKNTEGVRQVDNQIVVGELAGSASATADTSVLTGDTTAAATGDTDTGDRATGADSAMGGTATGSAATAEGRIDAPRTSADRSADHRSDYARSVSDDTIAAMVNSRLLWNTATDGTDIDVAVRDGVVTLSGRADDQNAKDMAENIARDTRGVRQVNNNLMVQASGQVATAEAGEGDNALSDTWVAAKVKSSLLWSAGVDGTDINVDVKDGIVSLRGEAANETEKRRAMELAQSVRGVKRVDDSGITIRPDTLTRR